MGPSCALSVSSNGSTWVKLVLPLDFIEMVELSVSSNGSTWVKLLDNLGITLDMTPFSILERIDVGETTDAVAQRCIRVPFSILERIDVGETAGV